MAHLATPMAVRVAATLGIADLIAAGTTTVPGLAEATDTHPDALGRVLRHLAAHEVLRQNESGEYALTGTGECLRSDHPSGIRAMLDTESAVGRAELSFVHLMHSVRTGAAAFPRLYGRDFWVDLESEPARARSFAESMGTDLTRSRSAGIVGARDWGALGSVVDVGGGSGTLAVALLSAFPELRVTVLDLPDTAESAKRAFIESDVDDRGEVVGGSFFDSLPPGAGGYLLSSVLHDWDDEPAMRILRRCAEAAGPGGSVFVIERIGAAGDRPGTAMDLRMLAYYGGKERDAAELTALAGAAGLLPRAEYAAGVSTVIELRAGGTARRGR
ncbi:methyltransferase [Amycolatopsis antarctica]|uniref:Methyltransferase n=2 Tax=Amycolatopsis antarctica TaxID=1854586 RepID=A0A263D0M2_9PSEU|nr:methyltransferase [Amycolatopsis antarctica]